MKKLKKNYVEYSFEISEDKFIITDNKSIKNYEFKDINKKALLTLSLMMPIIIFIINITTIIILIMSKIEIENGNF